MTTRSAPRKRLASDGAGRDDHKHEAPTTDPLMDMRLKQRYLLVVPVPFARDPDGRVWLDELWWHDLRAHLTYLENLTVLAPCRRIPGPEAGMIEALAADGRSLEFVEIFPVGGMRKVLMRLPFSTWTAWKAVGRSDLIHTGVAGWPIPVGAIVNPIALLRKKPMIIVVESAFWRLQQGTSRDRKARLRASLTEKFAKWSLRHAALAVYTHTGYKESLPIGPRGIAAVVPASWISKDGILSDSEANASWNEKTAAPHFLLASRLEPQKGISLFLDALRNVERKKQCISVDIVGSGSMRAEIEAFAQRAKTVQMRLLDPIPYGPKFMELLRKYHATIAPLTGDEQARILYDSFSQAVPVIATDTPGNREVVTDAQTGFLFRTDSAEAFAETLIACHGNPDALRRAGLCALNVAAGHTHADMHRTRAALLIKRFGAG